jgi:poly-gamma-glutamate capsule biosynthesis protein CapA/YwtB (metallophosphatase superfamily)
MASPETLAVTSGLEWTDSIPSGFSIRRFYEVISLPLNPPPDSLATVIESFEGALVFSSIPGEDFDPTAWEQDASDTYTGSGHSLRLYGNTWKARAITPRALDSATVWELPAKLNSSADIAAFGIADSANWMRYLLWGRQSPQAQVYLPVYQGWFDSLEWIPIRLAVGADWHGRFGYYPRITELHFINDGDDPNPPGELLFDDLRDITATVARLPHADFRFVITSGPGADSLRVQYYSLAYDQDSPFLTHRWTFGDGLISTLTHPAHSYERHGRFTVTLTVQDDSGGTDWRSIAVIDSPVTPGAGLWLAFVGDVMLARGYENPGGIIETYGVEAIFDGIRPVIENVDIASANLECPLTTAPIRHPTKSIAFKGRPENVAGLVSAGFDFVTLANNHTFDYLEAGMNETMYVLDTAGIFHTGCGATDLIARRTLFLSGGGLSLAMLAFSNRTGSYNNVQPFLDAARSRPGFAMWDRSAIEATVAEAAAVSDMVILNVHSGDEYQYQPQLFDGMETALLDDDIALSVVPDTTERLVRQYAIENGADLVITHHPHIIQGLEVYNGKLIAHSLGNIVFDLNLSETLPSLILKTHLTAQGEFDQAVVLPAYIRDWIPQVAHGQLATSILNYESEMSRRLDTWLLRRSGTDSAEIVWDTTAIVLTTSQRSDTLVLNPPQDGYRISNPLRVPDSGYPVNVSVLSPAAAEVRVGRERLWFGNMEDEGAQPWDLNSGDEGYDTLSHEGTRSIRLRRTQGTPGNVITRLKLRLPINPGLSYSAVTWLQTDNATGATVTAQVYAARTGGNPVAQTLLNVALDGSHAWQEYWADVILPGNGYYLDFRLNLDQSASGTGYARFDDLAVIEWSAWTATTATIPFPSDPTYLQVRAPSGPVAIVQTTLRSLP